MNLLPTDIVPIVLNLLDTPTIKMLREVDKTNKQIIDRTPTTNRTIETFREYVAKTAEHEAYVQLKNGWLLGGLVRVCRLQLFSKMTNTLKNKFPSFARRLEAEDQCNKLKSEIKQKEFDFPVMQLFGGIAKFKQLPPFTHETFEEKNDFKIEASKMPEALMRYNSDTFLLNLDLFIIRVKNPQTKAQVIQPYFRGPGGNWVTLDSRDTGRAPVGRMLAVEDRLFIDAKTINAAMEGTLSLREVTTKKGEITSAYTELRDLVINKKRIINEQELILE